ncbi:MAG: hypothetical protein IPJ69_08340 [Deltaproteobacteria bacterium]|nr:MAG: hypothetical protein IPJ69_08340 [Deltaproteobacteria bacterium]
MSSGLRGVSIANEAAHKVHSAYATKLSMQQIGHGSLQKTSFGVKSNKVFQTNEFSRFQESNKDLFHVISKSDKAKEIYSKKDIRTRDDLVDVVAQAANENLSGDAKNILTKDKLKEDPFMASIIAMNTGGIKDILNKEASVADKLLSGDAETSRKEAMSQLADKASSLFEKDHVLNDKKFFEENPKAAVYVIKNKDVVRDFTETQAGKDRAEVFRDEIRRGVNQTIVTNETNDFVQSNLQSGTYNKDFLNNNSDFTDYIAASLILDDKPTVAKVLKDNPHYNLQNRVVKDQFNEDDVTRDIVAKQASEKLGPESNLTEADLKKRTGLAQLILKNVSLQDEFKKEDSQSDFSILLRNERPHLETSKEVFQRQFRTELKERTLVSVIA